MKKISRPELWGAVFLVLAVFIAYWPALRGDFIWDDDSHISANWTLRSWPGLAAIWCQPGATCQYYPLSFTVFWADYHLWKLNPLGYHLQNVLLHGVAAILLWQVLARLKVRGAWLAGAIFALHPVCVMSVAWMTELKNTLSGVLALGAMWAYMRFAGLGGYARTDRTNVATAGTEPLSRWRFYTLALVLFLLALLAKTAVSFLPLTLLLVIWWQREKLQWQDVWPLLPMLGIAVMIGGVTVYVEQHSGGAAGSEFTLDWGQRVLVSGHSFWFYLGKLLFPCGLTFIYERWQIGSGNVWQFGYPVAVVAALGGAWAGRRQLGKGVFVALAHFYISTSLLILGVVLFMTRYSFVSDHWQYFGCMGIIALAAAGLTRTFELLPGVKPLFRATGCGLLLLVLGALTWQQAGVYQNAETMWRDTLAKNPGCWLAHTDLGWVLTAQGNLTEAEMHYREAIRLKPDNEVAYYDYGNMLVKAGRNEEAIAQYQQSLQLKPADPEAWNNLGVVLYQEHRTTEAAACFREAIRHKPDYPDAHLNLGNALFVEHKLNEAIAEYQEALRLEPDSVAIKNRLRALGTPTN
jgi:tetratricopeptide (TPR) repeat protein